MGKGNLSNWKVFFKTQHFYFLNSPKVLSMLALGNHCYSIVYRLYGFNGTSNCVLVWVDVCCVKLISLFSSQAFMLFSCIYIISSDRKLQCFLDKHTDYLLRPISIFVILMSDTLFFIFVIFAYYYVFKIFCLFLEITKALGSSQNYLAS